VSLSEALWRNRSTAMSVSLDKPVNQLNQIAMARREAVAIASVHEQASWALALSALAIVVTAIVSIATAIIGSRGNRLQRRVTVIEGIAAPRRWRLEGEQTSMPASNHRTDQAFLVHSATDGTQGARIGSGQASCGRTR
jgi:hypothetical protein